MHPDLFSIGPLTIHSYGLMLVIGFLSAIWLARRRAERYRIKPDDVIDIGFWTLITAMAGSKALYILINWSQFIADLERFPQDPIGTLKAQGGGYVFFGGLVAAAVYGVIFARKTGYSFWELSDLAAPSIALGHGFGRIGCFLAGCCYGKQCDLPWSVTFHNHQSLAPLDVSLHPTQLYSSINCFAITLFLLWLAKRRRFPGQIFWSYVLIYSITRFIIEIYRGDPRGSVSALALSTSQTIGIVSAVSSIIAMVILWKASKRTGPTR